MGMARSLNQSSSPVSNSALHKHMTVVTTPTNTYCLMPLSVSSVITHFLRTSSFKKSKPVMPVLFMYFL